MSNLVRFEKVDNELNILRIGGKSFLPPDVEWPTNPNGEKMVFIFNIPTNFLNSTLQFNYPKDQVISVSAYKTMYFEAHVCFLLYHFHCTKSQEGSKTSLLQWMKENFLSYYFPPRIYAKRRLVIKAWIIRRISPLL